MNAAVTSILGLVCVASLTLAMPAQTSTCQGVGSGFPPPTIPGFFCEVSGCTDECIEKPRSLLGGGWAIHRKCLAEASGDGCCSLFLVFLPSEDPYLAASGTCGQGNCGFGLDCVLWDVEEDGTRVVAACI